MLSRPCRLWFWIKMARENNLSDYKTGYVIRSHDSDSCMSTFFDLVPYLTLYLIKQRLPKNNILRNPYGSDFFQDDHENHLNHIWPLQIPDCNPVESGNLALSLSLKHQMREYPLLEGCSSLQLSFIDFIANCSRGRGSPPANTLLKYFMLEFFPLICHMHTHTY